MSMEITGGYKNYPAYESRRSAAEKTQAEKNKERLSQLREKFPSLDIRVGNFLPTKNDHKISCEISPVLLEKIQNDPELEKRTTELLEGTIQARKLRDAINRSAGWTTVYSHDYIDANGQYQHTAMTVKNDSFNEELRKKNREDTEKRIKTSIEKTREARKELFDKPAENKDTELDVKA